MNVLLKKQSYAIWVVLGLALIVGLCTFRTYGFSWDEATSHLNGQVSLSYVAEGSPELWTYSERFYGTFFEMFFAAAQKVFGFESSQSLFYFRHIITFVFFLAGVYVFYLICLKRFKKPWLALIGPVLLLISPRIFADAFYNSKDIPFLVLFLFAILTLINFLERPGLKTALLHGLATGALIALRLPGVFIPGLTLGMIVFYAIACQNAAPGWRKQAVWFGAYLALAAGFTVLLWPFLWQHPVNHFLEAFADMSRFSRQAGAQVLYFGKTLTASHLPWHYIVGWMLISTPLAYIGLFLAGLAGLIWRFVRAWKEECKAHATDIVVLSCFAGPLLAVIVLNSILYDGWRHMYFVYPAFLYIALLGIEWAVNLFVAHKEDSYRAVIGVVFGAALLNFGATFVFMIQSHPYQNVYFNALAGGLAQARDNFDLDYWGLSFRQGLEYIAAHDTDASIPIVFAMGSPDTVLILPPQMQARFEVLTAEPNKAKYVLSNYRWQQYARLPHDKEVYTVPVEGVSILSVFKMR